MGDFRDMRRKRQALSREATEEILRQQSCGVLAIQGVEGYPYAVPLSYAYEDGCLYFHGATAGHKVDAIGEGCKASFCVVAQDELHPEKLTTYFASAIAFGTIRPVSFDNPEELVRICQILGKRYCYDYLELLDDEIERFKKNMLCYVMEIDHLTGKQAIELVHA